MAEAIRQNKPWRVESTFWVHLTKSFTKSNQCSFVNETQVRMPSLHVYHSESVLCYRCCVLIFEVSSTHCNINMSTSCHHFLQIHCGEKNWFIFIAQIHLTTHCLNINVSITHTHTYIQIRFSVMTETNNKLKHWNEKY